MPLQPQPEGEDQMGRLLVVTPWPMPHPRVSWITFVWAHEIGARKHWLKAAVPLKGG